MRLRRTSVNAVNLKSGQRTKIRTAFLDRLLIVGHGILAAVSVCKGVMRGRLIFAVSGGCMNLATSSVSPF
jgi:hypothetical protein